jgi:hypothetical protein
MSRGPGKWQRATLAALEQWKALTLREVAAADGPTYTRRTYSACLPPRPGRCR